MQQDPLTCLTNHTHKTKGRKWSEYKLSSMSLDKEWCHAKSECLNMLHYLGTNNGNNSATLVAVFKTEQLLIIL